MPDFTLQLPDELILLISQATLASSQRLADIVALAKTCRRLYRVLIGISYIEAIRYDSRQMLLRLPLPQLSLTSVLPPVPVVLWAAEHNRPDTLALLWKAAQQLSSSTHVSAFTNADAIKTSTITPPPLPLYLTSAFWYPLPPACQHDLAHMRWRDRPWYEAIPESATPLLRAGWCTALHVAAREGHDEIIRALVLTYGARVDATARHVCVCRSRHMRLVTLDEGIQDPNDAPVTTPLHVALANGHTSTAQLLVQLGAEWSQEIILHSLPLPVTAPLEADEEARFSQQAETLWWDNPHNNYLQTLNALDSDTAFSFSSSLSNITTNRISSPNSSWPATPMRMTLTNYYHQSQDAALCSDLGLSLGVTGLRIAAANAMFPFLAWLGRTSRGLGDGGEFFEASRFEDSRWGALYYAAHATTADGMAPLPGDGDGGGYEDGQRSRSLSKDGGVGGGGMADLVDCLIGLGVQLPRGADAQADLCLFARNAGNRELAEVLERKFVGAQAANKWEGG